jgi:hypothetical protein
MTLLLALIACSGDSDTGAADSEDPAACGENYRMSNFEADIRDPFCQWQMECFDFWSDGIDACVDFYTGVIDNIDPCRMQECATWLAGAEYVCETGEPAETPEACLDIGYAE